jgi:hypothetical protein
MYRPHRLIFIIEKVNVKQHINIKELLKKWDSDYTLQQVKVIKKNFLFIQTNSFIFFTYLYPVLLVTGFGQVG